MPPRVALDVETDIAQYTQARYGRRRSESATQKGAGERTTSTGPRPMKTTPPQLAKTMIQLKLGSSIL